MHKDLVNISEKNYRTKFRTNIFEAKFLENFCMKNEKKNKKCGPGLSRRPEGKVIDKF
jgi:hypothetical protein